MTEKLILYNIIKLLNIIYQILRYGLNKHIFNYLNILLKRYCITKLFGLFTFNNISIFSSLSITYSLDYYIIN